MERKETTSHRKARRTYEERHKEERLQANRNFGTMIPREMWTEIDEFLKKNNITKVQLIFAGYEALKAEYESKENK